jgi:RND family efflux transporter MFP subunit
MYKITPFFNFLSACIFTLVLSGCSSKAETPPPDKTQQSRQKPEKRVPGIKTIKAIRMDLLKEKVYTGQIIPDSIVEIKTKSSGWLHEAPFYPAQRVEKNEVIAVLEHFDIQAQVEHARGGLTVAEGNWQKNRLEAELATKEEKRAADLFAQKHISEQEYDTIKLKLQITETALKNAEGQLAQARATLKLQQLRLEDCFIRSPVKGIVTARYQDAGNYITPAIPLLQLVDDSKSRIMINVAEEDLPFLKPGQKAFFRIDALGTTEFEAEILRISPYVRSSNRSATIELSIAKEKSPPFLTGMSVRVRLTVSRSDNTLVIPGSAIRRDAEDDKDYVFVLENNSVKRKNLTMGIASGNFIEIISGVSENDNIINENIILYDGMKIEGNNK